MKSPSWGAISYGNVVQERTMRTYCVHSAEWHVGVLRRCGSACTIAGCVGVETCRSHGACLNVGLKVVPPTGNKTRKMAHTRPGYLLYIQRLQPPKLRCDLGISMLWANWIRMGASVDDVARGDGREEVVVCPPPEFPLHCLTRGDSGRLPRAECPLLRGYQLSYVPKPLDCGLNAKTDLRRCRRNEES
jgi:hypothetical protein